MTRARRDDRIRLADIQLAARQIGTYIADGEQPFLDSRMAQDAVIRQLEIIGEAAGHVSEGLRSEHPDVPWRAMRGFASFSKHEYWRVDVRQVWNAALECESIHAAIGRIRPDVSAD